ncbi:MAG: hypothetical protein ACOC3G_04080 [Phycisphaeraceae bacterium]
MSTRNLMLLLAVVYLVASAGLAIGCQSSPPAGVDAEVYPQRRVAMQRPVVRFVPPPPPAAAARGHTPGGVAPSSDRGPEGVPWYAYRNDIRDSVTAGVRSRVLTRTYTRTHDHIAIYDGEARNHYHQRRRTQQVVETVR